MLLLLCLWSLLFLASLCSLFLFWPRAVVASCSAWPALRVGHAALCLLPVWFRGTVLCRLGRRRCECVDIVFFRGLACAHIVYIFNRSFFYYLYDHNHAIINIFYFIFYISIYEYQYIYTNRNTEIVVCICAYYI